MGLLDGGIAQVFASTFAGIYLDGKLHRPTMTSDGMGGGSVTFTDEPIKYQPDETTEGMRQTEGYVETDKRFIMLAFGVPEPDTDCELTADGHRWSVLNWGRDPATSHYFIHAQTALNG